MAGSSRPRTLARAVNDTIQVFGVAVIFAIITLLIFPTWLRWGFFYLCGTIFLVNVIAPFVEDWIPRSRVQAAGKAVVITESSCKTRWGNIRDNFRKSLETNTTMSGQKAKSGKLYKYSEQLSFLKKNFEERDTRSSIGNEEINQELSADEGDESMVDVRIKNTQRSAQDDNPINEISQYSDVPFATDMNATQTDSLRSNRTSKIQKLQISNPPKIAAATVMEYLLKQNESMNPPSTHSQDSVDAFLNGIAPALKNLSPRYWHYAKTEIFTAVQKYEHKMLVDEEKIDRSVQFSTPTYSSEASSSGIMDENPNFSD